MSRFNVAQINLCTASEGPGKRLAIWFQGCNIGCPGCCNPDLIPLQPRHLLDLESLVDIIASAHKRFGIEGVTYLGGEPTLQRSLPMLTSAIKDLGLGVISFTGRRYEDVSGLLEGVDMVIDGEYVSACPDKQRRIIGSSNQRIVHLTERYREQELWFFEHLEQKGEFNIVDSVVIFNGEP